MDDLIAFLRACLDEDDEALQRAAKAHRLYVDDDGCVEQPREQWADGTDRLPNHHNAWWPVFDRTERLAEVKAKRRILDAVLPQVVSLEDTIHGEFSSYPEVDVPDLLVKTLAQPYAGRPGWRNEWDLGASS